MITHVTSLEDVSKQDIVALGTEFAAESNLGPFDYEHFYQMTQTPLSMGLARLFLMEKAGRVVGILGGLISPLFFTKTTVALEMFWYVDKANRGSIQAVRLLEAYEKWAEQSNVNHIYMGFMENLHSDRLREFYEKRAYRKLESGYVRTLK